MAKGKQCCYGIDRCQEAAKPYRQSGRPKVDRRTFEDYPARSFRWFLILAILQQSGERPGDVRDRLLPNTSHPRPARSWRAKLESVCK